MHFCLFEDDAGSLEPLTLTRPVFDLRCGQTTLGEKQARYFGSRTLAALVRPHLADLYRMQNPGTPVNDSIWLGVQPAVMVNGRWLPSDSPPPDLTGPTIGLVGDEIAYAVLSPDRLKQCSFDALAGCLESWKRELPCHDAGGVLVRHPWDLVEHNADQLCVDFRHAASRSGETKSLSTVGPVDRLQVAATAHIDPMVVADTTAGPVMIDRGAVIAAFTRLEGPCYIGPHTHVFGAKVRAGTTLGPHCRIGGEIEATIVHGHSNKYHDGFLGHSYIGEWVNLGAGTHNSDLRNDYGPVTVVHEGRAVPTGLTKVGCFVGDHTKTGLGTLLNTGTSIGAFCNLLPSGPLAPKYMPSFTTWWNGSLRENGDWPRLLGTAREVMQRRDCPLTDAHAALYSHILEQTALERRRACRDFEQRHLRRSA